MTYYSSTSGGLCSWPSVVPFCFFAVISFCLSADGIGHGQPVASCHILYPLRS